MRSKRIPPEVVASEAISRGRDQEGFIKDDIPPKGRGVRTTIDRMKGDFLLTYSGELISNEEGGRRETLDNSVFRYFFTCKGKDWCIDSTMEVDTGHYLGRLVNHGTGKEQNCRTKCIEVNNKPHLCIFAIRDIPAGQELLYDYGVSNLPWENGNKGDMYSTGCKEEKVTYDTCQMSTRRRNDPIVEEPDTDDLIVWRPDTEDSIVKEPDTEALIVGEPDKEDSFVKELDTEDPVVGEPYSEDPIIKELDTEAMMVGEPDKEDSIVTEGPIVWEPYTKDFTVEDPDTEDLIVGDTDTEDTLVNEPDSEDPMVEEPDTEDPIVGESDTEDPIVEETDVEDPIIEGPDTEHLIVEEPDTEDPIVWERDNLIDEKPDMEDLFVKETDTEDPIVEEPDTEDPIVGEPDTEDPIVGEPDTEDPIVEETDAEDPIVGEPDTEDPIVEETDAEDPIIGEPDTEDPIVEETDTEDPIVEETDTEDPIVEETDAEDHIVDEPDTEDPVVEETDIEDPIAEESDTEDPIVKEPDGDSQDVVKESLTSVVTGDVYRSEEGPVYCKRQQMYPLRPKSPTEELIVEEPDDISQDIMKGSFNTVESVRLQSAQGVLFSGAEINYGFFQLFKNFKIAKNIDEASILVVPTSINGDTKCSTLKLFRCLLGRKKKVISTRWVKDSIRFGKMQDMETHLLKSAGIYGNVNESEGYRPFEYQIKGKTWIDIKEDDVREMLKLLGGIETLTTGPDTIIVCADDQIHTSDTCVGKEWIFSCIVEGKIKTVPRDEVSHVSDSDDDERSAVLSFNKFPRNKKIHVQTSKSVLKKKRSQKLQACVYCGKLETKVSRHMINIHSDKPDIAKVCNMKIGSSERRKALIRIAAKGNYAHNCKVKAQGFGIFIPKYRTVEYVEFTL